jgi:hypothetical protein
MLIYNFKYIQLLSVFISCFLIFQLLLNVVFLKIRL